MLSKMKVASMGSGGVAAQERSRSPMSGRASNLSEDIEDPHNEDNDSNNNSFNINNNNNNNNDIKSLNNNNLNINNNNNIIINKNYLSGGKKSQDQLLDIVEIARRRRISKDGADSLASFIRWSFSHLPIDPAMQRLQESLYGLGSAEKIAVLQAAAAAATAAASGGIDAAARLDESELVDADDDEVRQIIGQDHHEDDLGGQNEHDENEDEDDEDDEELIDSQHDIIDEIDQTRRGTRRNNLRSKNNNELSGQDQADGDVDGGDIDDELDNWPQSNANQQQQQQHFGINRISDELLRHHAKLNMANHHQHNPFAPGVAAGGSSAANLALMRSGDLHKALNLRNDFKRARTNHYEQDSKPFTSSFHQQQQQQQQQQQHSQRKTSAGNYLGNVVERLHQQQQLQQLQQQQQQAAHNLKLEQQQQQQLAAVDQQSNANNSNNNELSYHLQQFLQQQTSLEDLCSSVGIEENNQLVLAAAIHRALVDSVGGAGSGQGASASSQLSQALNQDNSNKQAALGLHNHQNHQQHQSTLHNNNNHQHQPESMVGAAGTRQRRTYNTRAAMMSAAAANSNQSGASTANRQQQQPLALSTNNNNRAQQQRHAQAAAALSALASGAGSGASANGSNTLHKNHNLHQLNQQQSALSSSTPMVDFECDTCGSSFDDRHRLMQHQSIHLELKKDWFTETPVDEVMKIFNRRRGEFLCNTCNLRFEATFDYDKHNHLEHGPRPYCCQFCGNGTRTFRFWRQYLNHLYDHRYIFSCTIDDCDFTVNRRDSLRFHIFRFHLNCQLPQNSTSQSGSISASAAAVAAAALQHQQLRGLSSRALIGVETGNNNSKNNKWDDDDLLDGNDMSVVE